MRDKRLKALALCLVFAAFGLMGCLHAAHCHEEDCPVCAVIKAFSIAIAFTLIAGFVAPFDEAKPCRAFAPDRLLPVQTPVTLKNLLLN